jgi:hypothetical protein
MHPENFQVCIIENKAYPSLFTSRGKRQAVQQIGSFCRSSSVTASEFRGHDELNDRLWFFAFMDEDFRFFFLSRQDLRDGNLSNTKSVQQHRVPNSEAVNIDDSQSIVDW